MSGRTTPSAKRSSKPAVDDGLDEAEAGSRMSDETTVTSSHAPADGGTSIRVAVRVRPFTAREVAKGCKRCISMRGNEVVIKKNTKGEKDEKPEDRTFR